MYSGFGTIAVARVLVLETQMDFLAPFLPSFLYGDSHLFRSKYYKKRISKASLSKLCAVSVSVRVVYSEMGESKSHPYSPPPPPRPLL